MFSEKNFIQIKYIDFFYLNYLDDLNNLNTATKKLQNLIYTIVNKSIIKKKSFEKSKFWWLKKFTNFKRNYFFIKKK